MIVVDGRTDQEKLLELLANGTEETALDYKATLDLTGGSTKHSLNLIKDCVAMSNLPTGGYIVVGVDDAGLPAHSQPAIDPGKFDSADLRARITRFLEAPFHVVSQPHNVKGRDVVLIYVPPNPDGLPVPFAHLGQYQSEKGMTTVFRPGEVVIREGTSNVQLRYAHWHGLLSTYRERIQHDSRAYADAVIAQFIAALNQPGEQHSGSSQVLTPLVVGMDWDSFDDVLVTHLEAPTTIRLERFLRAAAEAVNAAFDPPATVGDQSYEAGLDAITVIAINAVLHHRDDLYQHAVHALADTYEAGGQAPTFNAGDIGSNPISAQHWLNVAERVMAIGRVVTASRRFDLLPQLVGRRVELHPGYGYESWIRHAHVGALRLHLLPAHQGAALLSAVRLLLDKRPWLQPDHPNPTSYEPGAELSPQDTLMNQLAQFDLWWCVIAATDTTGRPRGFYPSCAALHQYRAQPAIDTIASDMDARRAAFAGKEDLHIAQALALVVSTASRESWQYGGWWAGIEAGTPAAQFLLNHGVEVDQPLE